MLFMSKNQKHKKIQTIAFTIVESKC